ncbi:hypothetical protein [Micromonospora sp. NPDC005254]
MRHRVVCLAVAALAAASGVLAVVLPASAASGCAAQLQVRYQYPSMLRGDLTVLSVGQPLTKWTLSFPLR